MTQKRTRIVFSAQQRTSLDLSDQGGGKKIHLQSLCCEKFLNCVCTPLPEKPRVDWKAKRKTCKKQHRGSATEINYFNQILSRSVGTGETDAEETIYKDKQFGS